MLLCITEETCVKCKLCFKEFVPKVKTRLKIQLHSAPEQLFPFVYFNELQKKTTKSELLVRFTVDSLCKYVKKEENRGLPEPRWTQLLYSCPAQWVWPRCICSVSPPVPFIFSRLNLNKQTRVAPALPSPPSSADHGRFHDDGSVNSRVFNSYCKDEHGETGQSLWLWDLRMSWVRCNGKCKRRGLF